MSDSLRSILSALVEEDGNPQVSKTLRTQFDSEDLRQIIGLVV